MSRRAIARALAPLLVAGALLGPLAQGAAAAGEPDYQAAARLLNRYGIVSGDQGGFRFYDPITRAEVAKLLVHSLGQEGQVARYVGRGEFRDTRGYWAEGHIALAKQLGLMKGYPEGDFRPTNQVSYAEVLTVLSRMVGLEPSQEEWPRTYLRPARDAGIIGPDMLLDWKLNDPATRGDVFVLLKRTLTEVKNFKGQSLLYLYLDKTPPKLTLDPQPEETQDTTLIVSGEAKDAAQVKVNGQPVELESGVFYAQVRLKLGPNVIRVQAIDDAGNTADGTVRVTRVPGAPGSVSLSGPSKVGIGQTARFSLTVRDDTGAEIEDRSKVEVKVEPDLGKFDPQTGAFVAGNKAGNATITVRAGGAQASHSIQVQPGPLDRLAVSPAEVSLKAGETTYFEVIGYDFHGNQVPVTDVKWSASSGTISDTGTVASFKAPNFEGTHTVTVSAGGKTATATVRPPNFQVASVQLSGPNATMRANGVHEQVWTATVLDGSGKVWKDYQGALTVTSSAYGTAYPVTQQVNVVDGVGTFTIKAGTTPGTAQITVQTNTGKTGTARVTVAPQQLQAVRLEGRATPSNPDGMPSGVVEAVALDQDGYPMKQPLTQTVVLGLTLQANGNNAWFRSNDQAQVDLALGPVEPSTGEVRSRTHIYYNRGAGTILVTGTPRVQSMSWLTVYAGAINADQVGAPARLRIEPIVDTRAGEVRRIYVNVLDSDNYRVTQPSMLRGAVVTLRDQFGAVWTATVTPEAGLGRAAFDVVQTKTGTYTYTATLQPGGFSTSETGVVIPAPVTSIALSAVPETIRADGASQVTLRAVLTDAYGNRVTTPSHPVTFIQHTNNGAVQRLTGQPVVNSRDGVAELKVTAGLVVGMDQFEATVPDPANPGATLFSGRFDLVSRGVAERLTFAYGDNDGDNKTGAADADGGDNQGTAGWPMVVVVDVLDRFGQLADYGEERDITLTTRNLATGAESSQTKRTEKGRATFSVTRAQAGTYAIRAEAANLVKALSQGYGGNLPDMTLAPGQTTRLRVTAEPATLRAGNRTSYSLVSVQLVDSSNNPTPNLTGQPIPVTLESVGNSSTSGSTTYVYGTFTDTDTAGGTAISRRTLHIAPGATATASVKFFSGPDAGTTTIKATALDGGTSSVTVQTVSTTGTPLLEVTPVAVAQVMPIDTADNAVTGQTVTVTAKDSNGYRLANFNGQVSVTVPPDAAIVAYLDPATQTWRTLDQIIGDGRGTYSRTASIPADRGQVSFRVRSNIPGVKVYTISATIDGTTVVAPNAAGQFIANAPYELRMNLVPATRRIPSGLSTMAIEVRVYDQYGLQLTQVTGPIKFSVNVGSNVGRLVADTVELQGGVATAYFESAIDFRDEQVVTVTAETQSLVRDGGAPIPMVMDSFTVDGRPVLTEIKAGGTPDGKVTVNDTLAFTFTERLLADSVLPGLTPGNSVQVTGRLRFKSNGDVVYDGLPGLGTLHLGAGIMQADVEYEVSWVTLSPDGWTVTLTLGNRLTGSADLTLSPQTGTRKVTMPSSNPIKDSQGNSPMQGDLDVYVNLSF